jgi:hypothetical protein
MYIFVKSYSFSSATSAYSFTFFNILTRLFVILRAILNFTPDLAQG